MAVIGVSIYHGANVSVRVPSHFAWRVTHHQNTEILLTLTPHKSTNIGAIDNAINTIESLDLGELFLYRKIAATYNINRTTLSRKHKRVQATNKAKKIN
jgi:hypothetical protein